MSVFLLWDHCFLRDSVVKRFKVPCVLGSVVYLTVLGLYFVLCHFIHKKASLYYLYELIHMHCMADEQPTTNLTTLGTGKSMIMNTHTHVYTHMHAYIYTCIYMHKHAQIYKHTHSYTWTNMHIHTYPPHTHRVVSHLFTQYCVSKWCD